jgi:PAS domain-containing protein
MSGYPSLASLRQAAQHILDRNPEPAPAGLNITALLHELQVHQVELDLQMDALKEALAQAEAGEARFRDLFQFAPMACFSVSPDGGILEANHKGLDMLGITAKAAAGHQLRAFFDTASLPALDFFLQAAGEADVEVATRVPLVLKGLLKRPILVAGQARAGTDLSTRQGCIRLALMEVPA